MDFVVGNLNQQEVSRVPSKCGAYVLWGFYRDGNNFCVLYVGRSNDLNQRLRDHLPSNESNPRLQRNRPTHFAYLVTRNEEEAYQAECWLYHHHNPPCNSAHPAKPSVRSRCPFPGCDK
jgi:excinuclease UvrABC nuclease subunit